MTKAVLYEQTARVAKAIGHPGRARLLDLLFQAERHVDELARTLDTGVTTVSSHLQVLRSAGLVSRRRDGTRIYYRIADDSVLHAWLAIRTVAERRSAELRQLVSEIADRDQMLEALDADTALALADRGEVTLIDVRPHTEYDAGHLPGALSVPLDELDVLAERLPTGPAIVAYCRDRYCVFAPEAVERLRERGVGTRLLDIGVSEWRERGLPTSTTQPDPE